MEVGKRVMHRQLTVFQELRKEKEQSSFQAGDKETRLFVQTDKFNIWIQY